MRAKWSRWPRVGDLLIEKYANGEKFIGLIYTITDSDSVFIKWSGKTPYGYYKEHGYAATNIHNQFHVYKLLR